MCGIVGFITKETGRGWEARRAFIEQALIVDTIRGDDSTGIFFANHKVTAGKAPFMLKDAVAGYDFVNSAEFITMMEPIKDYQYVIGHNRAATIGSAVTKNAHPFTQEHITLVHNGTVRATHLLPSPMHGLKDIIVDSEAITYNIAKHGAKATLEKIDGSFTLIWYDALERSLNIARNAQRPLHMASLKGQKTWIIASEAEQLLWLSKRLRLEHYGIQYPAPSKILTIVGGDMSKPIITDFAPYSRPKSASKGWTRPQQARGHGNSGAYYGNGAGSRYRGGRGTITGMGNYNDTGGSGGPLMDNRKGLVRIGGRWLPIPDTMLMELWEADVDSEETYEMQVTKIQPRPDDDALAIVTGWLPAISMSAVVYGMSKAIAHACSDGGLTIRPVGIRRIVHDLKDEKDVISKTVVCMYHAPTVIHNVARGSPSKLRKAASKASTAPPPPKRETPPDQVVTTVEDLYAGPHGVLITEQQFESKTKDGCAHCSGDISLFDIDEIIWVGEMGDQPLCAICSFTIHSGDNVIDGPWDPSD